MLEEALCLKLVLPILTSGHKMWVTTEGISGEKVIIGAMGSTHGCT